jgi:hypothetical protein
MLPTNSLNFMVTCMFSLHGIFMTDLTPSISLLELDSLSQYMGISLTLPQSVKVTSFKPIIVTIKQNLFLHVI